MSRGVDAVKELRARVLSTLLGTDFAGEGWTIAWANRNYREVSGKPHAKDDVVGGSSRQTTVGHGPTQFVRTTQQWQVLLKVPAAQGFVLAQRAADAIARAVRTSPLALPDGTPITILDVHNGGLREPDGSSAWATMPVVIQYEYIASLNQD